MLRNWIREQIYRHLRAQNQDALHVYAPRALCVYVVVRDDILPPLHQGIQAAHAVVGLGMTYSDPESDQLRWDRWYRWATEDKILILLGGTASDIIRTSEMGGTYSFYEPDLDLITAVAVGPTARIVGDHTFKEFKLAS